MKEYYEAIMDKYDMEDREIDSLSPLVLAYIGDSVYDVFIRARLVALGGRKVGKLHRDSVDFVKAGSQYKSLERITEFLTDKEKNVARRGRNSNPSTVPKNADMVEYRHATGFEALLGYLFLKRKIDRLMELLQLSIQADREGEKEPGKCSSGKKSARGDLPGE